MILKYNENNITQWEVNGLSEKTNFWAIELEKFSCWEVQKTFCTLKLRCYAPMQIKLSSKQENLLVLASSCKIIELNSFQRSVAHFTVKCSPRQINARDDDCELQQN